MPRNLVSSRRRDPSVSFFLIGRTIPTPHYRDRIALSSRNLSEPLIAPIYETDIHRWDRLFSGARVAAFSARFAFTSNRVSSVECQRRRPGSQTLRSRPLQSMVVGAHAISPIGGSFQMCSSTCTRRSPAYMYALRHVSSLNEFAADYLGRSLSRSSSPTTMWFPDGMHCITCPGKSIGNQIRGIAYFLKSFRDFCVFVSHIIGFFLKSYISYVLR